VHGLVVRQVRLVLWFCVLGLIDGGAEVRDPERTEESDADGEERERQQERGYDEYTVGTAAHLGSIFDAASPIYVLAGARMSAARPPDSSLGEARRLDTLRWSPAQQRVSCGGHLPVDAGVTLIQVRKPVNPSKRCDILT